MKSCHTRRPNSSCPLRAHEHAIWLLPDIGRRTHASFVKDLFFVHATTPDSNHRLIPSPRHLQQASIACRRTVRKERIDWDPITSTEEEWDVVQEEDKRMTVLAV